MFELKVVQIEGRHDRRTRCRNAVFLKLCPGSFGGLKLLAQSSDCLLGSSRSKTRWARAGQAPADCTPNYGPMDIDGFLGIAPHSKHKSCLHRVFCTCASLFRDSWPATAATRNGVHTPIECVETFGCEIGEGRNCDGVWCCSIYHRNSGQ